MDIDFVFQRYYPALFYFCSQLLKQTGSVEHPHDIVIPVFIKLLDCPRFPDERSLKMWLYVSVRNSCFNVRKREQVVNGHNEKIISGASLHANDYCRVTSAEAVGTIHRYIAELPAGCRELMLLLVQGHTARDISQMLNKNLYTVKNQIGRGRLLIAMRLRLYNPDLFSLIKI